MIRFVSFLYISLPSFLPVFIFNYLSIHLLMCMSVSLSMYVSYLSISFLAPDKRTILWCSERRQHRSASLDSCHVSVRAVYKASHHLAHVYTNPNLPCNGRTYTCSRRKPLEARESLTCLLVIVGEGENPPSRQHEAQVRK